MLGEPSDLFDLRDTSPEIALNNLKESDSGVFYDSLPQIAKLVPLDIANAITPCDTGGVNGNPCPRFGSSVAISSTHIVVGAHNDEHSTGSVYVFGASSFCPRSSLASA